MGGLRSGLSSKGGKVWQEKVKDISGLIVKNNKSRIAGNAVPGK
jgi:hypothetical protein